MSSKLLWRGTARSLVLLWVLVAIFVFAAGLVVVMQAFSDGAGSRFRSGGWIAPVVILLIGVIASVWSSHLAVELDAEEMRVRFGPGWPVRRIPWSRVISVEYLWVHPLQWGGWGYRVLPLRRAQAVVLRAGDGLRLELSSGRTFVVTVDQAKRALEVIRKLRSGQ